MDASTVNNVIDRIVRSEHFARDVLTSGAGALGEYELAPDEARAIAEALKCDGGCEPFAALRTLARFEPMFAAYSATATKKG